MAFATTAMTLADYRIEAIAEIGYGSTAYAALSAGESGEIDRLIKRGERTFWLHPPVDPPHVWSCLRDPGLLDLWGDIAVSSLATGVVAAGTTTTFISTTAMFSSSMVGNSIIVTAGATYTITGYTSTTRVTVNTTAVADIGKAFTVAVTVTGGAFAGGVTPLTATAASFYETMVGKSIVITGVGTFVIASYTSATVIGVTGNASAASKVTFSIASDGIFPLPTDFESPESSSLVFSSESWVPDVQLMNERYVTELRATQDQTGYPQFAAIRWATSDGTAAQSQELVTWPEPDQHYEVSLPYAVQPQVMNAATDYPRGGPEMADALLSVILAVCEEAKSGRRGDRWAEAAQKCNVAARRDRTRHHNFIAGWMRPDSGSAPRTFDVKGLVLPA